MTFDNDPRWRIVADNRRKAEEAAMRAVNQMFTTKVTVLPNLTNRLIVNNALSTLHGEVTVIF